MSQTAELELVEEVVKTTQFTEEEIRIGIDHTDRSKPFLVKDIIPIRYSKKFLETKINWRCSMPFEEELERCEKDYLKPFKVAYYLQKNFVHPEGKDFYPEEVSLEELKGKLKPLSCFKFAQFSFSLERSFRETIYIPIGLNYTLDDTDRIFNFFPVARTRSLFRKGIILDGSIYPSITFPHKNRRAYVADLKKFYVAEMIE